MTDISKLSKPTSPNSSCYRYDFERDFYSAHQGLLISSEKLANCGEYHDALYLLRFSIECFIKYTYCIIREVTWNETTPHEIPRTLPKIYRRAFSLKDEKLSAESIGHNFKLAFDILDSTSNLTKYPEYGSLKKELIKVGDWVEERYKERQNSKAERKYHRLKKYFDTTLNGCFKGLV